MERGHEEVVLAGEEVALVGNVVEAFDEQAGDHARLLLPGELDTGLTAHRAVAPVGPHDETRGELDREAVAVGRADRRRAPVVSAMSETPR